MLPITPTLCRERLNRILTLLERNPEGLSVRTFARTFSVWRWEIDQAVELGFVALETRKPPAGRPSLIAQKVSNCHAAKLPPCRAALPPTLRNRQERFAFWSVFMDNGFAAPVKAKAYQKAFASARSYAGAAASASRLMKSQNVRAMRAWYFARVCHEVPDEPMPQTRQGIATRLRECGSWRAKFIR
jgi:hypothetical protein